MFDKWEEQEPEDVDIQVPPMITTTRGGFVNKSSQPNRTLEVERSSSRVTASEDTVKKLSLKKKSNTKPNRWAVAVGSHPAQRLRTSSNWCSQRWLLESQFLYATLLITVAAPKVDHGACRKTGSWGKAKNYTVKLWEVCTFGAPLLESPK